MIEVTQLVKIFGDVHALDGVSFTVERGSIFGLIGPNGAGKTTCLNILSTLLKPTAGAVVIGGLNIEEHVREIRRKIGYMPDFFGTYRNVTAFEYLDFYGGCCGVREPRRSRRIDEVLALTNLQGKRDELVDNLSRGMKQRLCLAKALIHEPELLLLDEPASGLDPRARIEIRNILRKVAEQSSTVLISSHILSELGDLCTHIAVLEQGKLCRSGKLDAILREVRPKCAWRLQVIGDADVGAILGMIGYVTGVQRDGNVVVVEIDEKLLAQENIPPDAVPPEILRSLSENGLLIQSVTEDRANLEDAFLSLTKGLLA